MSVTDLRFVRVLGKRHMDHVALSETTPLHEANAWWPLTVTANIIHSNWMHQPCLRNEGEHRDLVATTESVAEPSIYIVGSEPSSYGPVATAVNIHIIHLGNTRICDLESTGG